MTREEILKVHEKGPAAVVELVLGLLEVIRKLEEGTRKLEEGTRKFEERVKVLEDRLAQNSRNSSKPPSSDGYQKPSPKSQRPPSEKKQGGQVGHPGATLERVQKPDHVELHPVQQCEACHRDLRDKPPSHCEGRQVFDLPQPKVEVTEHRAETKVCDHCGHVNTAAFPQGVDQPVQYGPRLKGLGAYLNQYQLLPYERVGEFFFDVYQHPLSPGSLFNFNQACFESLESVEQAIKEAVAKAGIAHFDETGFRIEGKRQWLHVASTKTLTHYAPHAKRGKEATDAIGILPVFQGKAIHDHWYSYFTYDDCSHGLCNGHHLRELTFIDERFNQAWAQEMRHLLAETLRKVEETKKTASELPPDEIRRIEECYAQILQKGWDANPPLPQPTGKRGRKKQSKPQNLLHRLSKYRKETLAFMYDFNVPFDNNQGERDLRMMKVQQKISGCFRSEQGAQFFCRIRGYLSTLRKQAINVLEALQSVFVGTPVLPAFNTS